MKNKSNTRIKVWLILASIFAILSFSISYFNKTTTKELAATAEILLHKKETLAQEKLVEFTQFLKTTPPQKLFTKYQSDLADLYKNEGIGIYVYKNDSLCFWSNNEPAIDLYSYIQHSKAELIKIRNGWFECITQTDSFNNNCKGIALIAIKNEYDLENKYIKNKFSKWLELPDNTKIKTDFNYLNPAIKSKFGNALFEISRSDGIFKDEKINILASTMALLSLFSVLIVVFFVTKKRIKNSLFQSIILGLGFFIIRTLMLYFKFPSVLYGTKLFDAAIFADGNSFYFSFLGDVLLNSFLFFIVSVIIYKTSINKQIISKSQSTFILIIGSIGLIYYSIGIRDLIFSLVNNSTITFNINELFSFTKFSFVGFLSIGLLIYSFYLFTEKYIETLIFRVNHKTLFVYISIGIAFILFILIKQDALDYLWPVPIIILCLILKKFKASHNFINIGLIVLVFTIIVTSLLSSYEGRNKKQTYDALSFNLTDRQDIIAENEFVKISSTIKSDSKLKNLVSLLPLSSKQLEQSLRQVDLSGYFERYDVLISLFKKGGVPVFYQNEAQYLDEDYFKQQIEKEGSQTISDELYFIDKENKPIKYIAKLDLESGTNNPEDVYHLYMQMEPKNAINLGSFPDLLLDKSLENKLELKQVSYAVYENNKLQANFGDFQYPLLANNNMFANLTHDDFFSHYIYYNNKNTKVIISEIKSGLWQGLTSISYLFIFFSIVVLISILFNSLVLNRQNNYYSLNYRIQFILVSIVFLSLACVVIGTIWVVETQFETKNKKELVIKSNLVLKELNETIGSLDVLDFSNKNSTDFKLKKLSKLIGSDISLFNSNGVLYSSSQPAIYDQGLISKFMHPSAFSAFMKNVHASYSQRETIGLLNYLSAYIPFYNNNDKLIGFINLPYFSRQKDLEKELTAYLTTLLNIYTILFIITTLLALLVSNLLTKPLRIIKQQISNIKFGSHNEALQWKSKDEIGDLVNEYNNMLLKLEKNSKLLAQSERESAWREMAKQVAHEIKNPLTPMKLNIQHLQRVVATNPDNISERVNKVSILLIEQIDTLSHIATEFSNFAKLPVASSEKINLYDVLQSVTNLFQQNTGCNISLSDPVELPVLADKEQCIRIFTNLLKNAEQAIPLNREGQITINATVNESSIVITIKDNGCGIEDAIKSKLFNPNFTTKTTGTGLGLAMVKSLVTSFSGTITFETEVNVGSVFTLTFPKQA